MFKNLTIRMKLISSFTVIVALIAVLALYSTYAIGESNDGFSNYRDKARDSVLASDVQANMLMVRMNVLSYLRIKTKENIENFNKYFNLTVEFIKSAKVEIKNVERAPLVLEIEKILKDYKSEFVKVTGYMDKRDDIVNNNLNVTGKKIEQLLSSIINSAQRDKDTQAALETAKGLRNLLLARLYVMKFLDTNSKAEYDRVNTEFAELDKLLISIRSQIQNPTRKAQLREAISLIAKYENGVTDIYNTINIRNKSIDKLNTMGPAVAELADKVKLSIKNEQDKIGPEVAQLNSNIQTLVTTISIIILVIAILLAVFLPRDITRLINSFQDGLLNFFRYLNKETTEARLLKIDGTNEITHMADVVNENITKTKNLLEQDAILIDDVKRVVAIVGDGKLNERIEKDTQNEGLQELKVIFNEMLDITSKNVCQDINKINDLLAKYAKLDFRDRIQNDNGGVAKGLNNLADIINEMLVENKQNGLTLEDSSTVLLKNVDTLNRNSNEAAAALEETAAALEEITSNITNNTDNVVKMSNYANELSTSANDGQKLAQETTISMDEINAQVTAINEAISVIDQIAFQTNILSLNAAVEAATAGEAGKGFAVVAGEVRNLAARSAEAASEIKSLVENATVKANNGKTIADKMISGYNSLNENVLKTMDLIKDVEMASKEQQSGIEQINDAVTSLDQQTQQNAMIATQTNDVALQTDEIAKLVVSSADEKEFNGKDSVKARTANSQQSKKVDTTPKPTPAKTETKKEDKPSISTKPRTITADKSNDDDWESF